MEIRQLELTNFRNIPKLELTLSPGLNLLIGPNSQGKTNLLEALHYLSTTRSFRGSRDSDLIHFDQDFARLAGADVEVVLQPGVKTLKLRGKDARAAEVLGELRTILFSPEDMSLLSGPPQNRRNYLDELISRIDRKYLLTLISYHRTVRQRNKLLWQIRERNTGRDELASWDELLVRDGTDILGRRLEVVGKLQTELDQISPGLFEGKKTQLAYQSKIQDESTFAASLKDGQEAEIRTAASLVGPHRDDLSVTLGGRNLGRFGSRGEQRAAILALKLVEVNLDQAETGERPVLLLDDVLSELDAEHQARLLSEVDQQQTVLSATTLEVFPTEILKNATIYRVTAGRVTLEKSP